MATEERKEDDLFIKDKAQRRTKNFFVTSSAKMDDKDGVNATTISSSVFQEISKSFADGTHLLNTATLSEQGPILYMLQEMQADIDDVYNEVSASAFQASYFPFATIDSGSIGVFSSSLIPDKDDSHNLGSSTHEWKNLYVNGTAYIDSLDLNGTNITTTLNAKATTAGVNADLLPHKDGTHDLGSSTYEWKDLYIDGTANIDRLDVDAIGTDLLPVTPAGKGQGQNIGSTKLRWSRIFLASHIDVSGSNLIISSPSASAVGDPFDVVVSGSMTLSGSIAAADLESGSIGTIDAPFKDLYVQSSSIYLADMSDHGGKSWKQMSKSEKLQRATVFRKDDVDKLKRGESLNESGIISASGDLFVSGSTKLIGQTEIHGITNIHGLTDIRGGLKINDQAISDAELRALRGLSTTDSLQDQLNSKQDTITFGISNTNVIKAGSGIADDDFLRINGTTLEGRSASELKGDLSLVKGDVGLGNVDNTSDASKPVSTLTTAALGKKLNLTGGTMTGLVAEPYALTDSATIATAKGVIDARATRVFQILNQKGQTWNVVEATPTYRGQELTIIAIGAGTITHSNPMKGASGLFVTPNGSNLSVAANTVVKFVTNFAMNWYQVV